MLASKEVKKLMDLSGVVGVCGNPEQLGSGVESLKLQTNRPSFFVQDALAGQADQDEIAKWIEEGFLRWGAWSDLIATRVSSLQEGRKLSQVTCHIIVADLGSSGVLADQRLPYTGGTVLQMRINSRIKWRATDGPMFKGTIDPLRTITHELGHFIGHQHWPQGQPEELMEPVISNTVIKPQSTEGSVAAGWFGQPKPVPTPTPDPGEPVPTPEPPRKLSIFIQGEDISIPGYRVTQIRPSSVRKASAKETKEYGKSTKGKKRKARKTKT